jgi:hypothetical protein
MIIKTIRAAISYNIVRLAHRVRRYRFWAGIKKIAAMVPIYFKLDSGLFLMIIPDTAAHLDGHTVITHTYSIFKDAGLGNPLIARSKESTLHLEAIKDPNYYGYLTFELPGKLFTYTAEGGLELNNGEVEQVIELLSHVRTNPALWNTTD